MSQKNDSVKPTHKHCWGESKFHLSNNSELVDEELLSSTVPRGSHVSLLENDRKISRSPHAFICYRKQCLKFVINLTFGEEIWWIFQFLEKSMFFPFPSHISPHSILSLLDTGDWAGQGVSVWVFPIKQPLSVMLILFNNKAYTDNSLCKYSLFGCSIIWVPTFSVV